MRMLFEDKIVSWRESLDIFDEIGRKLFRVEAKQDGKRLKIYDPYLHNKSVATLKACDGEPAVEIKHGTRFVSAVRPVSIKSGRIFDLGFLDWCAAGDFERGVFTIFDGNDRTVATLGKIFYNHETKRVLDTLPEFCLYSLTFALAIDVQISEAHAVQTP